MKCDLSEFLTVAEAAKILRLHPNTLYRWIRADRIPAIYVFGELRLEPSALRTFLRECTKKRRPSITVESLLRNAAEEKSETVPVVSHLR